MSPDYFKCRTLYATCTGILYYEQDIFWQHLQIFSTALCVSLYNFSSSFVYLRCFLQRKPCENIIFSFTFLLRWEGEKWNYQEENSQQFLRGENRDYRGGGRRRGGGFGWVNNTMLVNLLTYFSLRMARNFGDKPAG